MKISRIIFLCPLFSPREASKRDTIENQYIIFSPSLFTPEKSNEYTLLEKIEETMCSSVSFHPPEKLPNDIENRKRLYSPSLSPSFKTIYRLKIEETIFSPPSLFTSPEKFSNEIPRKSKRLYSLRLSFLPREASKRDTIEKSKRLYSLPLFHLEKLP
ncbi:hypothetical protein AVEN_242723-1 [Araneus ventricosus]|uniref:Uncharacterized protein n=1 Tax=Araneus ventricosus TaxID=182803 RepID=A0A4Y2SX26_ARAVE|nr:hypothetical protein AVEN_242723-1 [Araneus ventricosus]